MTQITWTKISKPLKFKEETYNKCLEFSEQVTNSYYSNRGQSNLRKVRLDHLTSKLGELLVYRRLSCLVGVTEPDFCIYDASSKSWDCDLKLDTGHRVHVKSQNNHSSEKFGRSYTFQYSNIGSGGRDDLFTSGNSLDICAFVYVDLFNREAQLESVLGWEDVLKVLGDPVQEYLRGIKKVFYPSRYSGDIYSGLSFLLVNRD